MMKKTISLLLCAVLIFGNLSGCSREEPVETTEPTQAPTQAIEEVELTVPRDERPYVGVELEFLSLLDREDPRTAVVEQAAEVFEIRTGAVVNTFWLGGDENALAANFGGDVKVDIFAASVDTLETILAPYALDLTSMAEKTDYLQRSHEVLRDQVVKRCGYLAAIPQTPVLYGMYYNADAVSDAGMTGLPQSWGDFLEFSRVLTEKGYMSMAMDMENANIALELHLERHLGFDKFQALMIQAGWTQDMAYIDLFKLAIDYASAGYLAKGDPAVFPSGQDKLALSNVVMIPGSSELCAQVERSTLMDVNWGVFPYPGDGTGKGFGVESQVLAIHRDCANAQAAFDFIMMLTTGEFDQLYADAAEGIPADPNNECGIAGAMELLNQAEARGFGLLRREDNELFSRLWNGWYKVPGYFASAMNGISGFYIPAATEGVG